GVQEVEGALPARTAGSDQAVQGRVERGEGAVEAILAREGDPGGGPGPEEVARQHVGLDLGGGLVEQGELAAEVGGKEDIPAEVAREEHHGMAPAKAALPPDALGMTLGDAREHGHEGGDAVSAEGGLHGAALLEPQGSVAEGEAIAQEGPDDGDGV